MLFTALFCYCLKLKERNLDWSDALLLWKSGNRINPNSAHAKYNYGLELSLRNKKPEAINVLKECIEINPNDFSPIFLLSVVYQVSSLCKEANAIADFGLNFIDQKKAVLNGTQNVKPNEIPSFLDSIRLGSEKIYFKKAVSLEVTEREQRAGFKRDGSNLLGVKALCIENIGERGRALYRAIEVDPSNEYVIKVIFCFEIKNDYMSSMHLLAEVVVDCESVMVRWFWDFFYFYLCSVLL